MGEAEIGKWADDVWAKLPQEARDEQVKKAFERLVAAKSRRFNKTEYRAALEDVFKKVSAECVPHMEMLSRLSAQLLKEGRVADQFIVEKFTTNVPEDEWTRSFMLLWANPFDRVLTALQEGYERGPLTQEDVVYRLWIVYGRVAYFIKEFFEKEGWTEDFGPALAAYQEGQVDLALKTPSDQPLPSLTLGEILSQRRH